MLPLKKYFPEELIQMTILLSLCGIRVDVGLEPFLPRSWCDMILGQNSAPTQTPSHNQNTLHPKNVDLERFFTARRLLGWVHSLDRIQVPQAELETWLVQRESAPLLQGFPDQPPLMDRAHGDTEIDQREPAMEQE
ncbi:PREDICTED: nuclear factor erythroid 2-related factor 1-like, partial [Cyprinodon variegatus]|uniref:nuclear factor erythroid 2-related factor 1-like n=2 Tax=Cyprinodon TaxID=28741 RepID=UPI0007429810